MVILFLIRWRIIGYYLSSMFYLLGFSHVVPIIFSLLVGERFLFILFLVLDLIVLLLLAFILRRVGVLGEINIVEAYTVAVLAFVVPSFTCALPIMGFSLHRL